MSDFQFENLKIGLALSGGGFRASVFHAGVLKWMAERDLLSRVSHISSVSGGSLFTGLVFKHSDYTWPTKKVYLEKVYPGIRYLLTTTSLQKESLKKLFFDRSCWRLALRRAQIISKCIESFWGVKAKLGELPKKPVWSINGTTAENGKRFRFQDATMGDYRVGYADVPNFKLSTAMAVSAAFPGGIGPVRVDTSNSKWRNRKNWDDEKAVPIDPPFNRIHLYDGGVYDNLGIESLFDIGSQEIKSKKDDRDSESKTAQANFLMVSDAGAINDDQPIPGPLSLGRLIRVIEVAFDQCRSLRVRSYVNFIKQIPTKGMYFQIGFDPHRAFKKEKRDIQKPEWLSKDAILEASRYSTSIKQMKSEDFDKIARHGYETALANENLYLKSQFGVGPS